jgi:hypothetical protein
VGSDQIKMNGRGGEDSGEDGAAQVFGGWGNEFRVGTADGEAELPRGTSKVDRFLCNSAARG